MADLRSIITAPLTAASGRWWFPRGCRALLEVQKTLQQASEVAQEAASPWGWGWGVGVPQRSSLASFSSLCCHLERRGNGSPESPSASYRTGRRGSQEVKDGVCAPRSPATSS